MISTILLALLATTGTHDGSTPLKPTYVRAGADLHVVAVAPDILKIEGQIEDGDAPKLLRALTPRTRTLIVNSVGGEVSAALDMAEEIERRGLRVVVDGACASSCANYLFAAAVERIVLPGSVLLWHGGPTPADIAAGEAQIREAGAKGGVSAMDIDKNVARETARERSWLERQNKLYARRGLNTALLYELSGLARDAQSVVDGSTPTSGSGALWVSHKALRCAGFKTRQTWEPIETEGWTKFRQSAGFNKLTIVRSSALEQALCKSRAVALDTTLTYQVGSAP